MNVILITLLLQSSLLLPPRTAIENPASASKIPPKLQKDYDKLWNRFVAVSGDDAKLGKDLQKFEQKQKAFDAAWVMDAYLALYKGDDTAAREKFAQALAVNAKNRIAMYYLAELAYSHGEYDRAASLYVQLEAIDPNRPELQTKRQKAFLIATDNFLRSAARAEADNRLSEAEGYYRQALNFAPDEPSLHARLADLLQKENKLEQAAVERKAYESLVPTRPGTTSRKEEAKNDSLDDIGRWSQEIGVFHQIRDAAALTREQFALLVVRYFPQVTEFRRSSQILIDVEDSPARSEIQNVVGIGLMDPLPNHYFVPAGPLTRSDLALALAHLTRLLGIPVPSPSITVADLSPSNGLYTDLQVVLSLGVMTLDDSGRFNLGGDVSGRDAIHAAEGLLHSFQQAQR